MYKSILVPIDLGHVERGKAMIDKARSMLAPGGRITLINVVERVQDYILAELPADTLGNLESQSLTELRAIAKAAGGDIAVSVRTGRAATEILQAAKDGGSDLIVVASHNPGMQDFFIGSTAVRLVRHAHCSVLVDR